MKASGPARLCTRFLFFAFSLPWRFAASSIPPIWQKGPYVTLDIIANKLLSLPAGNSKVV